MATVTPSAPATRDPYLAHRRAVLAPDQVRKLSRLRPVCVVVDAMVCWVTILAAWALVAIWPDPWTVLLAIPLIGSRYYGLFIIGHDGLHHRLFREVRHNDLFNDVVVLGAIGAITRINNRNHLDHHHRLATDRDPDRHKHGCFNKTTSIELLGFLTGATSILRSVANVFVRRAPGAGNVSTQRYTLRDAAILLGWQVVLIGGLSLGIGWWAWPVLWLLPVYVFAFLGDNLRSFAEHSHPEPDGEADGHRLITYVSNPLERWFVAPMNMNFHAAHHLWPSVPYYNLPIADAEMRRLPGAEALEWRGSYLGYLWRYWRALPLEKCRAAAGGSE